MHGKQTHDLT